jgi:hypothetical protein
LTLSYSILADDTVTEKLSIEFDSALVVVNFDPITVDGNGSSQGHTTEGNGILNADEM